MRLLTIATLLAICSTAYAQRDEWWNEADETMPELVEAGWRVVAFSTNEESGNAVFGRVQRFRYVLHHPDEPGIYLCSEAAAGRDKVRQACYTM